MTDPRPTDGSLTRRDFVRTTAAATAAGIVAPSIARARSRSALETIRVGLVGCGGRGTGAAMQAISADPNAILIGLADAFPERVDSCVGRLKANESIADRIVCDENGRFAGFDAYRELIDSGVDVVLLATPPVFRPIHLRYAIERDKHVFCEKPVAVDAPGVRSVMESAAEAKRRGLALMSGFCWRYSLPQREFWSRVNGGAIGDVRSITTTYNTGPLGDVARTAGMTDMEWQLRNWKAFAWSSGDHIVEQAIHAIDWIHWAKDGALPVRAWAVGGRQCRAGEWTGDMYDHFAVVYEYADGARGFHVCRQIPNCDNDNSAYVIGTAGEGFSNPWAPNSLRLEGNAEPWRYRGPNNDMYQQEHDELFASIRAGEPVNDGVRMSESTMMGIMGRMCAYTGRTLEWDQCLASEESLAPASWAWDAEPPRVEVAMPDRREFR